MKTVYKNIHEPIIEKCRQGDSRSQYELYKLYYKAMYNTSLRIVQNETEAEDIMQESFLSAFRKIDNYNGEVSFGAWLKKIVINNSLDALKKKKIAVSSLDEMPGDIAADENESIDSDLLTRTASEIKKTILELAEGYRVILSLYLIEGYDHEEIGEILGISPSTSRSQYTRAKRKLADLLNLKGINHYKTNLQHG